jgi:hypothetical protein
VVLEEGFAVEEAGGLEDALGEVVVEVAVAVVEVEGEEVVGGRVVDALLHVRLRGRRRQARVHAPEQLPVHVQLMQLPIIVQPWSSLARQLCVRVMCVVCACVRVSVRVCVRARDVVRTASRRRVGGVVLLEKLEGAQDAVGVHLEQDLPPWVVLVCSTPRPPISTTRHDTTHTTARHATRDTRYVRPTHRTRCAYHRERGGPCVGRQ